MCWSVLSSLVCTLPPVCNIRMRRSTGVLTHSFRDNLQRSPRFVSIATCSRNPCTRRRNRPTLHPALRLRVRTHDSMARIKVLPPSRPSPQARPKSLPTTAKESWSAAIELAASNGQAMVKKPGGELENVRWPQGVSASSVGGAEAKPAMTAVRKSGQPREVLHGHAAVRARKRNPADWESFAYPKLVFTDEGTTPDVQRTLDLQTEKATALGMTSKEITDAFFSHRVSEVIGGRDEALEIDINISDRWFNRNVQELMLSLRNLGFDAEFENVDECLNSILGRISSITGSESVEGVYVVIDCGHSGMVCFKSEDCRAQSDALDRMLASPRSRPDRNTRFTDRRITLLVLARSTWL